MLRAQPGGGGFEARVVEQAPGEDPDGVEKRQVAGDEKKKTGDDRHWFQWGDAPGGKETTNSRKTGKIKAPD